MELKPTAKVAEALALAQREAPGAGNPEITPAHLALAIAEQPDTTTPALLTAGGTTVAAVATAARAALAALPRTTGSSVATPGLGQAALQVLQHAQTLMQAMGDTILSTDGLLLALVEKGAVKAAAKAVQEHSRTLRGGHKVT